MVFCNYWCLSFALVSEGRVIFVVKPPVYCLESNKHSRILLNTQLPEGNTKIGTTWGYVVLVEMNLF